MKKIYQKFIQLINRKSVFTPEMIYQQNDFVNGHFINFCYWFAGGCAHACVRALLCYANINCLLGIWLFVCASENIQTIASHRIGWISVKWSVTLKCLACSCSRSRSHPHSRSPALPSMWSYPFYCNELDINTNKYVWTLWCELIKIFIVKPQVFIKMLVRYCYTRCFWSWCARDQKSARAPARTHAFAFNL